MQIQQRDIETLIQFVNLVLSKGQFNFSSQEALQFAELTMGIKDLKDKMEKMEKMGVVAPAVTAPRPQQPNIDPNIINRNRIKS